MATYTGTSGNNTLTGSSSDDTINGLGGVDLMIGGGGNDSYYVDQSGDQILELAGQGTDVVYASASYQLGDQVENLVLTGIASIEGTGNALANTLTGNGGDNTLTGLGGNDTLDGGWGDDTAIYSAASSGYRIGVSDGKVTVTDVISSNGDEGSDTLSNIEQIAFSDGSLKIGYLYGETQVNTYTDLAQSEPEIAALADGGYVVTWTSGSASSGGQDGDSYGIYAQRYDSSGQAAGAEFLVNTTTANQQYESSVTGLAKGGFVVTWTARDTNLGGIFAQLYDADGRAIGSEFLVNSEETDNQDRSSVTALTDGGFVVAWTSATQDASGDGIYAQRYAADGSAVGSEFLVNSHTADDQFLPQISGLADGGFVIAWSSNNQDGDSVGVHMQRYDADGATVGGEILVNTHTTSIHAYPRVASLADGSFVVTWFADQDGSTYGIYAQRYGVDGNASGDEFQVNTYTTGIQRDPVVAGLADGSFVVAWESDGQDGSDNGIYAQRYDADGNSIGSEFRVSTTTADDQSLPVITALADGGFVVAWQSDGQDGSDGGVYSQRYDVNGAVVSVEGDAGNNTLSFVSGSATLKGGLGNDTYLLDDTGDTVVEARSAGTDTVQTAFSYTLGINVENLTLTGSASVNATGNNLNNKLTGNAGANILDGGLGDDTMTGGKGNDTYIVSSAKDKIVEASSGGTDTAITSVNYTLSAQVEKLQIISSIGRSVVGNTMNNTITGGYGNDTLNGGGGKDALKGGLGNDTYVVDTATDTLTESANQGTDTVRSSVTFTLGTNFETLILTGSAAINGTGNTLANSLTGNSGANLLNGSTGNDTLNGGLGKDTLTGGTGHDNFRFTTALSTSANVDKITDFKAVDDTVQLENAIFKKLTATGTLSSSFFKANASGHATDANDYIVYETDTGKLFYDADGSGKGAAIQFALIGTSTHPTLTAADFQVV